MEKKKQPTRYSPEVRARAVRMVMDHRQDYETEWAALVSISSKFGCSGETLRIWLRQAERDRGLREGLTSEDKARLKALERDVRELRQATAAPRRERQAMRMRGKTGIQFS